MSAETLTLADVFTLAQERALSGIHTAMPGKVVSYSASAQTVDVEPMLPSTIYTEDGDKVVEPLPVLPDVPVCFPRGGGYVMAFPIAAGDFVLLIFSERSIDRWRATGAASDPGDTRQHSLTGAVAIPGVYPTSGALNFASAADLVVGKSDAKITIKSGGNIEVGASGNTTLISGGSQFVALANLVDTAFSNLITALNSHVHTSAAAGSPTSPPTVPFSGPASTAATKVKAT